MDEQDWLALPVDLVVQLDVLDPQFGHDLSPSSEPEPYRRRDSQASRSDNICAKFRSLCTSW